MAFIANRRQLGKAIVDVTFRTYRCPVGAGERKCREVMIESSWPVLRVDSVAAIAVYGETLGGMARSNRRLKLILMTRNACQGSAGVPVARSAGMTTFARRGRMRPDQGKACLLMPLLHVRDKPGVSRVTSDASGPELLLVGVGVA